MALTSTSQHDIEPNNMCYLISLCSVKLDRDRNSVMKKSDIEHMVTTM